MGRSGFPPTRDGLNAELFVELLKKIIKYRKKPIHLVVDSLPARKTALLKKCVISHRPKAVHAVGAQALPRQAKDQRVKLAATE